MAVFLFAGVMGAGATVKQDSPLELGRRAYEASDYAKAVEILQPAAVSDAQNGEIHLLLAKTYSELREHDAAIASAERAVATNPKNSEYHEWLARAYGNKAEHAGPFPAMSLARKSQKEFEVAVQLDGKNFSARQALVEFDCAAPGIVGGGEDKARPHIQQLLAMDAAEGHYAAGNCRRQKKDFAAADAEFATALESQPKSKELIYDIGDYAVKHNQQDRLLQVADAGEKAAPADPRGKFYRGVAFVLKKGPAEKAEHLLREYLKQAPNRTAYPRAWEAHNWLGKLYEGEQDAPAAVGEYQAALKLDPKNKSARDALKRLGKN